MKKFFSNLSTLFYSIASVILIFFSITIIFFSIFHIISNYSINNNDFISTILESIGAIVISVAIIDVAKYMVEEEVIKDKELKSPREARETLTKILVIIIIAVSIEGLVYIFKAGTKDIKLLIYPSILIISSSIMIMGLGIYQKLSTNVEKELKK